MGIKISEKAETALVEVSSVLIAAGSAGAVLVAQLPAEYQVMGGAVCGALVTAGTTILAVWHKFVNVLKEKEENPAA
jgi:hypothetical protein